MRITSFGSYSRVLTKDTEGNVLISVVLSIFLLLTCIGVAVDMARAQVLQSRMSIALDSAALAALKTGATDTAELTSTAQRFFSANFPTGYLAANSPVISDVVLSNGGNTLAMTVTATQTTQLLSLVGIPHVTVGTSSQVTKATKQRIEIALVLDNTGSMADALDGGVTKLDAMKSAAKKFLDIVYADAATSNSSGVFVGIVPFSQTVNIGKDPKHVAWVDPSYLTEGPPTPPDVPPEYTSVSYDWREKNGELVNQPHNWAGCVEARYFYSVLNKHYNYDDTPPNAADPTTLFWAYNYPSDNQNTAGGHNKWNDYYQTPTYYFEPVDDIHRGPNLFCPKPITPLTNDKSALSAAIDAMTAAGDTNIDQGVAWGWRLVSPRWRGLWGGMMDSNNLPDDYDKTSRKKIVIMMTDGQNHVDSTNYTAYNFTYYDFLYGYTTPAQQIQALDMVTEHACSEMAQNNIFIYTIGFGTANTNPATDINPQLLQYCANGTFTNNAASTGRYFFAPSNHDLDDAFTSIANSLTFLRVSK